MDNIIKDNLNHLNNPDRKIDIVGLGVSTLDILKIVDHFPNDEEVQRSFEVSIDGGGPVATALAALAKLGGKAVMIDSLGNDWIGKLIIKGFKKGKVSTDKIIINKNYTSSSAVILVRIKDGARTIVYSPGNSPELMGNDIDIELIKQAKVLHLNGRHFNACLKACQIARESGTLISFDGGSSRFREELRYLVPLTDLCIISKDFAEKYTGEKDIIKAAKVFLQSGPSTVVITNGINGSWLFNNETNGYHQKAFVLPWKVVDTTGCGDCFHGAFIFALCRNSTLFDAISFASAAAALNTRKLGGRAGLPHLSEVLEFLKNYS